MGKKILWQCGMLIILLGYLITMDNKQLNRIKFIISHHKIDATTVAIAIHSLNQSIIPTTIETTIVAIPTGILQNTNASKEEQPQQQEQQHNVENINTTIIIPLQPSSLQQQPSLQQQQQQQQYQNATIDWIDTFPIDLPFDPQNTSLVPKMTDQPIIFRTHTPNPTKLGMVMVENPRHFVGHTAKETDSYNKPMHMFHIVEFYIVAYAEMTKRSLQNMTWILSQHFSERGLKGENDINWILAKAIFGQNIQMIGYEYTDLQIHQWQQIWYQNVTTPNWLRGFHGNPKRNNYTSKFLNRQYAFVQRTGRQHVTSSADAVLLINRHGLNHGPINKMWYTYLNQFPCHDFHRDIQQHMKFRPPNTTKLIVTYIDRQESRRRLPRRDHEWLLQTLHNTTNIEFRHVKMETLPSTQQMELGYHTDFLIGVHGNGMTHQFWMKPGSYVVEMYWRFPFQFDYATASMLMKHNYTAIFNGWKLDDQLVQKLSIPEVESTVRWKVKIPRSYLKEHTKLMLLQMIQEAVQQKKTETNQQHTNPTISTTTTTTTAADNI